MSFKVCVIGCGDFAARVHGPAHAAYAASDSQVELTACCDLDRARAEVFASKFGYQRVYTDMEEMLERESPQAVAVLVAPQAAARVALAVMRRGIPLFLEKPPGITLEEVDALIAGAAQGRVVNQVAFNRRYMPLMLKAREIIDAGIAPIQQVTYNMIRYQRDDPDFSVTAIHAIDAAMFLAGSPYRKVRLRFEGIDGLSASRSNVTIMAECESGVFVNIHIQPMAGYLSESFSVHGVSASLLGEVLGPGLSCDSGRLEHWVDDKCVGRFSDEGLTLSKRTGIDDEFAAFCRTVRAGGVPTPALSQCRWQVRVMEALRNREEGDIVI
jgi:myo-inositol 2-dehydrogenase/D-chiro-inositol 1-dehydrogenase